MAERDPLASLVVDERALAREELAELLRPYLRFTGEGSLLLEEAFDRLTTLQRVACVLLAFRAAHLLGLRDRASAAPREVVQASGMPAGTVRPKLAALGRLRFTTKEGNDYSIPTPALRRVADLIRGEGK